MTFTNHKEWLDNEYNLWIEALQSSTVDNFKDHPQVKRMLGEVDADLFLTQEVIKEVNRNPLLLIIDNIGREPLTTLSGTCLRMVYYALQVIDQKPLSIVEIGGGVGQFYAVLRALGYKGEYCIYDLPEVRDFHYKYLQKVNLLTGLKIEMIKDKAHDFCISFYALGEFDKSTKEEYIINIVNACPHGFIIWNPHSGADAAINFKHNVEVKQENPLTSEGNLQITW